MWCYKLFPVWWALPFVFIIKLPKNMTHCKQNVSEQKKNKKKKLKDFQSWIGREENEWWANCFVSIFCQKEWESLVIDIYDISNNPCLVINNNNSPKMIKFHSFSFCLKLKTRKKENMAPPLLMLTLPPPNLCFFAAHSSLTFLSVPLEKKSCDF